METYLAPAWERAGDLLIPVLEVRDDRFRELDALTRPRHDVERVPVVAPTVLERGSAFFPASGSLCMDCPRPAAHFHRRRGTRRPTSEPGLCHRCYTRRVRRKREGGRGIWEPWNDTREKGRF